MTDTPPMQLNLARLRALPGRYTSAKFKRGTTAVSRIALRLAIVVGRQRYLP